MKTGDKITSKNANWSFRGKVFKKFDTHINKSIPLYKETQKIFLNLTDFFLQKNSKIVDLGCSTGTFLNSVYLRHAKNKNNLKFIGIDEVDEMIKFCKKKYKEKKIKFFKNDINKIDLKNSCIISLFYTLQFISTSKRQFLVNKIYKSLNWGGALFLVEKVRASDARFQDIMNQFYIDYKLSQKYTHEEIISKSRSLKGVMEPFSTKGNLDMLKRSGFTDVITVFKYGCFEGFLAIK